MKRTLVTRVLAKIVVSILNTLHGPLVQLHVFPSDMTVRNPSSTESQPVFLDLVTQPPSPKARPVMPQNVTECVKLVPGVIGPRVVLSLVGVRKLVNARFSRKPRAGKSAQKPLNGAIATPSHHPTTASGVIGVNGVPAQLLASTVVLSKISPSKPVIDTWSVHQVPRTVLNKQTRTNLL
jgi:hypothetical protein